MDFDFKVTAWERVTVSDNDEARVFEAIKSGEITTANDIFCFLDDTDETYCDLIHETAEPINLTENDNQSTIEVLDGEMTIWTNERE